MKNVTTLLILTVLFTGRTLQAQNTGDAAAVTVQEAKSNAWQNWTFAAIALVTAAAAVFIVSMDDGHRAPKD